MPHNRPLSPLLIPPVADFWTQVAQSLLNSAFLRDNSQSHAHDLSPIRVVVPTLIHIPLLRASLAKHMVGAFILPRITTMSAWLSSLPPDSTDAPVSSDSDRLMSLYAELRQHAWLKKLFTARRNTDLLPLAQILLTLSDELTQSLLPTMQATPDIAAARWQAALAQLPAAARQLLSDEAQLVWSIWKAQLDGNDASTARLSHMMRLAKHADAPLLWVMPVEDSVANTFSQTFLRAYAERQPVLQVKLDWRSASIASALVNAWPELLHDDGASIEMAFDTTTSALATTPAGLSLCAATSLEDEALQGAQTIINWLQSGKSSLAIVAQDRVVARRIRALLERAQVVVADETGWMLSTTRAAAAIVAWFEVITARAETVALLDLFKSPFFAPDFFGDPADKPAQLMRIETLLRRANVPGGWRAVSDALAAAPSEQAALNALAGQAALFVGRKTFPEWIATTHDALTALGMHAALDADAAGQQVIAMLDAIVQDCLSLAHHFSFAEWRAFVSLQLEATTFLPPVTDRRVVMLPMSGTHLRCFDAVLVVGADAAHLPSQRSETLFFANAVRHELGLATREMQQRRQLRDFTEMLSANGEVVVSWQAHKNGEANRVSSWIERLQLTLACAGAAAIPARRLDIDLQHLTPTPVCMPQPSAAQLLPKKLSASGYNSLVACPYQFFVTRMLGLSALEELSDMPEKRDYGDWLHQILKSYHDTLRDQNIAIDARETLLKEISHDIFSAILDQNAAALGYYMRWQKVLPAYLSWANQHEEDGWRFVVGEQRLEKKIVWPNGEILLHGRIDRIDENADGARAILDYKTKGKSALSARLRQHEDHQLAFYGLLSETPIDSAHFVALEATAGKTGDAEAPHYLEWQQKLGVQLVGNMRAVSEGAGLPASGTESICQYCDVRGLCRKGAW